MSKKKRNTKKIRTPKKILDFSELNPHLLYGPTLGIYERDPATRHAAGDLVRTVLYVRLRCVRTQTHRSWFQMHNVKSKYTAGFYCLILFNPFEFPSYSFTIKKKESWYIRVTFCSYFWNKHIGENHHNEFD